MGSHLWMHSTRRGQSFAVASTYSHLSLFSSSAFPPWITPKHLLMGGLPPSTDLCGHTGLTAPQRSVPPHPPALKTTLYFHPEPPPLWQRRGLSHHHLTAACSQPPRTTLLTPWMHSHSSPKLSTAGLLPFLFPKQRDRPAGPTSLPWGRCQGGGGHGTWLGVGCSALTTPLLNNPAVLPPFFLFYP